MSIYVIAGTAMSAGDWVVAISAMLVAVFGLGCAGTIASAEIRAWQGRRAGR
jgi:hypothetical protein